MIPWTPQINVFEEFSSTVLVSNLHVESFIAQLVFKLHGLISNQSFDDKSNENSSGRTTEQAHLPHSILYHLMQIIIN
jgi:hypothetical protein